MPGLQLIFLFSPITRIKSFLPDGCFIEDTKFLLIYSLKKEDIICFKSCDFMGKILSNSLSLESDFPDKPELQNQT